MAHDAPVNTVPTDAAGALQPAVGVTIVFDVADFGRTLAFYEGLLGFRAVRTERAGIAYETRVLVSERYPGVALFVRKSFQRPVIGSLIGSVVQIGFRDPALASRVQELEGKVRWVLPPAPDARRASFFDPDGYVVELFC
jgi:catechol 2,3-dioxygenase-like lactoylglutathione lyase family enzyme